ncbi:MAG: hypothetical protein WC777_02590 [Candidatus Gracilibacteria bacterium]|jgi:hypothetical protein
MITNSELEAGRVFDPAVQGDAENIGFVHRHLEIALSHTRLGRVERGLDGDAFVLLEQLRFAHLVIRSVPSDARRGFDQDEMAVCMAVAGLSKQLADSLLANGEPQTVERKRSIFQALSEFDKLTLNRADLLAEFYPKVQVALDLAEHYKRAGILMRFYRLNHYHPNKAVRGMAKMVLFDFLMPALDYVGESPSGAQSPEELSDIMSVWSKLEGTERAGMPTGLSPQVLDSWLCGHERDLLSS